MSSIFARPRQTITEECFGNQRKQEAYSANTGDREVHETAPCLNFRHGRESRSSRRIAMEMVQLSVADSVPVAVQHPLEELVR